MRFVLSFNISHPSPPHMHTSCPPCYQWSSISLNGSVFCASGVMTVKMLHTARFYRTQWVIFLFCIILCFSGVNHELVCLIFYLLITYSTPNSPLVVQVSVHSNTSGILPISPAWNDFSRSLWAALTWASTALGCCTATGLWFLFPGSWKSSFSILLASLFLRVCGSLSWCSHFDSASFNSER